MLEQELSLDLGIFYLQDKTKTHLEKQHDIEVTKKKKSFCEADPFHTRTDLKGHCEKIHEESPR